MVLGIVHRFPKLASASWMQCANRFCYNGEMLDLVTQQYYLRARFYNLVIGRFTQEDTYYGDGLNLYQYCQANPVGYVDPSGHNCETTQSRYNSNEEQHPKADAAEAYQSATEKGNSKSGSKSKWWHEGYVDDLSDIQMILGVKQSDKGLSTLGSATSENAMSAGKAWVGDNYNVIKDNSGNILGYSSADGMRAFRIQYKPKEGMWRANFQENIMVNNQYPNPGQHSSQLKNVHIDILD